MATIETTKVAKRWQMFCDGYNWMWYLKATMRWIMVVTAVIDLIVFGVSWGQYTFNSDLGVMVFAIIAPMISLIVSMTAIVLLFRQRKRRFTHPAWLLCGDTFTGLLLVMALFITADGFWDMWMVKKITWSPEKILEVSWGMTLALGCLHVIVWSLGIFEINTHRRMLRGQRLHSAFGKSEDLESANDQDDQGTYAASENVELRNIDSPKAPVVKVEMPNTFRVELPDGRMFELPEGCQVEFPGGSRAELPGLRVSTGLPAELESPTSSKQLWDRSPVSTRSY